jgi:eukaryotic-like serine/threonine-protein kinase
LRRRGGPATREIMENTRFNLAGSTGRTPRKHARPAVELRNLGGYRLLRRLGEGGMGAVYLGYKEGEEQPVAIKVLSEHLVQTPGFVDRFHREARNGASLSSPHIVRSYLVDLDQATGKHFLVLEFIDGPSAQTLLDRLGRLPVGDAASIVLGIARALEHAHSRHIIHRDIKPDNILLTPTGVAKLADLGLAKKLDEASPLTITNQAFGTTPYMPYEQALNARYADERSDIYALGATFYHLVTGVLPFTGPDDLEVIEKKKQGDYVPASEMNPALPTALDRVLARMLAREPSQRFQSASDLIAALEASGLVAERPSFTQNGQLALVKTPIGVTAEAAPTRINLDVPPPRSVRPPDRTDVWHLRYRNRKGRIWCGRATTTQIVERLQTGQLPSGVEARRQKQDSYHPLAYYLEFQSIMTHAKPARKVLGPPKEGSVSPRPWFLMFVTWSLFLGLLAAAAAVGCMGL